MSKHNTNPNIEKIREMREAGATIWEITRVVHSSRTTVIRYLRLMGLTREGRPDIEDKDNLERWRKALP